LIIVSMFLILGSMNWTELYGDPATHPFIVRLTRVCWFKCYTETRSDFS